jgi:hypothetical protein
VLHGVFLVVHRLFRGYCDGAPRLAAALTSAPGTVFRVCLTMMAFALSLAVFRAPSLAATGTLFCGLFGLGEGVSQPDALFVALAIACMVIGHALAVGGVMDKGYQRLPAPVRGLGYVAMLLAILLLTPVTTRFFIYFQF